jgi:hypothetical protein
MKIFNRKTLLFLNRQIVRLNWGYGKFYVFFILINAVSNLITALTITQVFNITITDILLLYFGVIIFSIGSVYILSRMNILQDETKQTFNERTKDLYFEQVYYNSLLIAKCINKTETEINKEIKKLERKLFGMKQNDE